MQGFIFVAPEGTASDKDLGAWVGRARAFVDTLPPKVAKPKKAESARKRSKSRPAKAPAKSR